MAKKPATGAWLASWPLRAMAAVDPEWIDYHIPKRRKRPGPRPTFKWNADNYRLQPGPLLLRLLNVGVGGISCRIATEDAGLYRDALGCMPPAGLPDRDLATVEGALEKLLYRYARTRGPFLTRDAATRFGLLPAQVEPPLRVLEANGTLLRGEIRPGDLLGDARLARLAGRARTRLAPGMALPDD